MSVFLSHMAQAGNAIETASKKAKSPQRFCGCGARIWRGRFCKPCSSERLAEQNRRGSAAAYRRRKHG